jgi:predicted flavoprotein YhiN
LESGDSKELLRLLEKKVKENKCEIKCNNDVKKIKYQTNSKENSKETDNKKENLFEIETES